MAKVGRNDACPCGSGKKYKRCCEARESNRGPKPLIIVAVAAALVAAIIAGIMSAREDAGGPADGRTWSAEHGHYH
jgi:hypothetical protein